MSSRIALFLIIFAVVLAAVGCGSDTRLLSIQVYSGDPNLAHNTSYYIAPTTSIQFQIQGWYSNRTVQTIANSSGKWASTNTGIAAVSSSGLATSAGPTGVTTISATVDGHASSIVLGVCDGTVVVCPPPPSP